MIEDLRKLLGIEEEPVRPARQWKNQLIKVRTHLTYKGKVVWVLICRGKRKVTLNPNYYEEGRSFVALARIYRTFWIKEIVDDGRAAAWVKQLILDTINKKKR